VRVLPESVPVAGPGYRWPVPRNQPEQQAPPVQRLRLRYAKRGRLRFTSHRDFSRAFERAVFRARIPMAYSSGFNPHPRISYAGAAPTGSASEAEYVEIGLAQVLDPAEVLRMLDESLPTGLDVLECVESPGGALHDKLQASLWRLQLTGAGDLSAAVEAFLAADEVQVERMTKRGVRQFDARGAVVALRASTEGVYGADAVLELVVEHQEPAVRPDDVVRALTQVGEVEITGSQLLTRISQGILDREHATIGDPLAVSS
jgi:radical SAM-linked protein